MPKKVKKTRKTSLPQARQDDPPVKVAQRRPNGTWAPGFSGSMGTDAARARRQLNLSTISAMQSAFDRGGRQAIEKVMKQQPAVFLKMLVLLVPRELEITTTRGAKGMTDEQLEAAVQALESYLARRQGDAAKVIEGEVADTPSATPT